MLSNQFVFLNTSTLTVAECCLRPALHYKVRRDLSNYHTWTKERSTKFKPSRKYRDM